MSNIGYLVVKSGGEYSDAWTLNLTIFLSEQEAQDEITRLEALDKTIDEANKAFYELVNNSKAEWERNNPKPILPIVPAAIKGHVGPMPEALKRINKDYLEKITRFKTEMFNWNNNYSEAYGTIVSNIAKSIRTMFCLPESINLQPVNYSYDKGDYSIEEIEIKSNKQ